MSVQHILEREGINNSELIESRRGDVDTDSAYPILSHNPLCQFVSQEADHHETPSDALSDQNDESLNRWKASLGLGTGKDISDPNDPRLCVIKSLALVSSLPSTFVSA